jgi:DNA-binding FrmR family transcriptional regulator
MAGKKVTTANVKALESPNSARNEMAQKRLARIKGQITGVERMFTDGRYCPEIIQQIRSVRAALKSLEVAVLETHIQSCVRTAITSRNATEADQKLNELLELLKSN